jgi:hypothetical protein
MKALGPMSDITSSILFLSSCNVSLDTALRKGKKWWPHICQAIRSPLADHSSRRLLYLKSQKTRRFEFNSPKDWPKLENMCPQAIYPRGHIAKNSKYIYIHPGHRQVFNFSSVLPSIRFTKTFQFVPRMEQRALPNSVLGRILTPSSESTAGT